MGLLAGSRGLVWGGWGPGQVSKAGRRAGRKSPRLPQPPAQPPLPPGSATLQFGLWPCPGLLRVALAPPPTCPHSSSCSQTMFSASLLPPVCCVILRQQGHEGLLAGSFEVTNTWAQAGIRLMLPVVRETKRPGSGLPEPPVAWVPPGQPVGSALQTPPAPPPPRLGARQPHGPPHY